jgi:3-oxoacyl-[acyl-carrier protein] reductase
VTGASQGIGESIARTLARDGAKVVVLDIEKRESALKALAEQIGGRVLALDLTAEGAVATIVEAARADGGWDGVVHNAGITLDRTLAKMPRDRWDAVQAVNLIAPLAIDRALTEANLLRSDARVVAVSSIAGIAGNRGQTNYAFSKAGVIGWVESSASVYARRGMAINAVAPGFIESAMTARMPIAMREAGRRLNSLAQGGQPADVAEVVAWLASPASAGVNGQVLRVCGQSLLGA